MTLFRPRHIRAPCVYFVSFADNKTRLQISAATACKVQCPCSLSSSADIDCDRFVIQWPRRAGRGALWGLVAPVPAGFIGTIRNQALACSQTHWDVKCT